MGMEVLKVSSKSNPNSVAGALAGVLRETGSAEIQVIGAGALNQAVKAIAIARGFVAPSGIDLVCIPAFTDIVIDGEEPVKDVKKREDLYWGAHQNEASDLTTIFNTGWQAARSPEITSRNKQKRYVNENPRWSGGHDGTHDPNDVPGLLAILGPEMEDAKQISVHLRDIAPTILRQMNIPIPNDLDGRPFKIT